MLLNTSLATGRATQAHRLPFAARNPSHFVTWVLGCLVALCLALFTTAANAETIISSSLGSPTPGAEYTTATGRQTGRLIRDGTISTCANPKANPGTYGTSGLRTYDAYTFTNNSTDIQCVAITMAPAPNELFMVAYSKNGLLATSPQTNYAADPGTSGSFRVMSFNVLAGESYTVAVHEVDSGTGLGLPYTLTVGSEYDPVVTAISPSSGPIAGGTVAVITGSGFTIPSVVTIGGAVAQNFPASPSRIEVLIPPGVAGLKDVTVSTPFGQTTASNLFCQSENTQLCVSTISPNAGPVAGGTLVTITGLNFAGATSVSIGGTQVTNFTVVSDSTITALTAAHSAGPSDVVVTTPNGTATGTGLFTYVPEPTIVTLTPPTGLPAGGSTVTINGTGFVSDVSVDFGGTPGTHIVVISDTQLTVQSPGHPLGSVPVKVITPGGTSNSLIYTYKIPTPSITDLSSIAGPLAGGNVITITGTGLSHVPITGGVKFGSAFASYQFDGDTRIDVTVPAASAAGPVNVTVSTSGGTSNAVTYTYVAMPTVSSFTPDTGPASGGTVVTITGTHFTSDSQASFGNQPATTTVVNSPTSITATAPVGAGVVDVMVTTAGGVSMPLANSKFTYDATPVVTGISPASGPTAGGTAVTITGVNLGGATAVNFGSNGASSVNAISATQITAIAPPGVGSVDIVVTTPDGTSAVVPAGRFTYGDLPTVTALATKRGPTTGGTVVVITGTALTDANAVKFGTINATGFTVNSATQITAIAPAAPTGVVNVTVTTAAGTSAPSTASQYKYQATSAVVSTPNGDVTITIDGAECGFNGSPSVGAAPASDTPSGSAFPYGQIAFKADGCTSGGTTTVSLLLPKSVEPGTKLYKQIDGKWLEWAATFNGTTVQFKVTDNNGSSTAKLTGDNDPTPGSIDDPIMIASPQAMAATPTAVPTLSQWALMGLSMLVAFFGVGVVRRRSV